MATLPPHQRLCSVGWNEMAIKDHEEYSIKYGLIEGLVDLGPIVQRAERAKYVLSFNLTSLDTEPLASTSGIFCFRMEAL